MTTLNGINHVAKITSDLDRMAAFYNEVFDSELIGIEETTFGRLGFIRVGETSAMNVFEVKDSEHVDGAHAMFGGGHLDHFGLDVADPATFFMLRQRLVDGGHATGYVTDFGPVLSVNFTDPDGLDCEITLVLDRTYAGIHEPREYVGELV